MLGVLLRWFFVKCFLAKIINSRIIQILLPALSTAYFLTISVWGKEWEIFTKYKVLHEQLFLFLLFLVLISQIYRAIAESIIQVAKESYLQFLENFMVITASIVNHKLRRFASNASELKNNEDTFKIITQPKAQIEYIIDQSISWLTKSFFLSDSQISITVIRFNGQDDTYVFDSHKSWKRTSVEKIKSEKSAAVYCLEKGEPVFFADKFVAAKKNEYFLSDRDERMKSGSAYCYPVFVKVPSHEDKFIISFVTYGKRLCAPNDEDASKIAQSILKEICRRIELELTLYSIRSWQFGE